MDTTLLKTADCTIYLRSAMGHITRHEVRELELTTSKYAQYDHALKLRFKAPRQRKWRGSVLTYDPFLVVVKGTGPAVADPMDDLPTTTPGITARKSRYASCDPRWVEDFRRDFAKARCEVLFDAAAWDTHRGPKADPPEPVAPKSPNRPAVSPSIEAAIRLLAKRPELAETLLAMEKRPEVVQEPRAAWGHFVDLIGGQEREHLAVMALGARARLVKVEVIAVGNDSMTIVCPRTILRWALKHGARSLLIAHNHPSGDATPSQQDIDVTRRLSKACDVVGIPLCDHMIIGNSTYTSLAEEGTLPAFSPPTLLMAKE